MVTGLALIVLFVVTLKLSMPWIEDYQTYKPMAEFEVHPSQENLTFEEIDFISTQGTRIYGWYFPIPGAEKTLVLFHGNAGNISHNLFFVKLFQALTPVNVYLFDYRGYGKNGGRSCTPGILRDAEEAILQIKEKLKSQDQKLIFFGRSLGGVLAIETAARVPCDGLIVENTFLSFREIAKTFYPFIPLFLLTTDRLDAQDRIGKVTCPVLVVHSTLDHLIPFHHGERLFEAAKEPKEFYPVQGAGHDDAVDIGGENYLTVLKRFIESV